MVTRRRPVDLRPHVASHADFNLLETRPFWPAGYAGQIGGALLFGLHVLAGRHTHGSVFRARFPACIEAIIELCGVHAHRAGSAPVAGSVRWLIVAIMAWIAMRFLRNVGPAALGSWPLTFFELMVLTLMLALVGFALVRLFWRSSNRPAGLSTPIHSRPVPGR